MKGYMLFCMWRLLPVCSFFCTTTTGSLYMYVTTTGSLYCVIHSSRIIQKWVKNQLRLVKFKSVILSTVCKAFSCIWVVGYLDHWFAVDLALVNFKYWMIFLMRMFEICNIKVACLLSCTSVKIACAQLIVLNAV